METNNVIALYTYKGNQKFLDNVIYIEENENPMKHQPDDYPIYLGNQRNYLGKLVTFFAKSL